jgi:hypothetical protein
MHSVCRAHSASSRPRRATTCIGLATVLLACAFGAATAQAIASPCAVGLRGALVSTPGSREGSLADVRIVATWSERGTRQRSTEARSGADGAFLLCGLPSDGVAVVRALTPTGRTEPQRVELGAALPTLTITVDVSRRPVTSLVGSVVRVDSLRNIPLSDVEVTIPALGRSVRTDSAGQFVLADIVPGTYRVIARRIGSGSVAEEITFAPNDEAIWHVPLLRLTTLSQVDIVAKELDPQLLEFEEHRRLGLGRFLTREDLDRMQGRRVGDILRPMTGVRIIGGGHYQFINSRRFVQSLSAVGECQREESSPGSPIYVPSLADKRRGIQCTCYAQVYVDGRLMNPGTPTEPWDLNELAVTGIESVEWYSSPAQTPFKYSNLNSSCGVLVLHRRRDPGEPPPDAADSGR